MTEALLYWGLGLLALSLLLVVVEVFLPTAGVLAVVSVVLAVVGIVCLFRHDWRFGVGGVLAMIVLGPAVAFLALQVFPSTPLGRKIINADGTDPESAADGTGSGRDDMSLYINREAEALTDLRPGGFVRLEVDGSARRIAASSEVAFIPAGTRVRITAADGLQVRVRPV